MCDCFAQGTDPRISVFDKDLRFVVVYGYDGDKLSDGTTRAFFPHDCVSGLLHEVIGDPILPLGFHGSLEINDRKTTVELSNAIDATKPTPKWFE